MPPRRSLTLAQETAVLLGSTNAAPGSPPLRFVDGPNGVRGVPGATAFPACLVVAATFRPDLARRYGAALAREVRAAGANVLLGPGFDILRVPWAGRSSESFGEDPLVAGELGGHVVAGLQAEGVLAVAKHFVANNFEWRRTGAGSVVARGPAIDVEVDAGTLRDIYLEPFRRAVSRHGLRALMTSYNRLGGLHVAESADLLDLPRREWGFDGVYVPDFIFAVRDPAAALAAGLDLPGLQEPGATETAGRTADMVARLDSAERNRRATRILETLGAVGLRSPAPADPDGLGTESTLELAEEIAVAGSVLLRNEGVLPILPATRVALIAPVDLRPLLVTGGSASVDLTPQRLPDLAAELAARNVGVTAVDPGSADAPLPTLAARDVVGGRVVLHLREGADEARTVDLDLDLDGVAFEAPLGRSWSARTTFELRADRAGLHHLAVTVAGDAVIRLGDREVRGFREASPMITGPEYPLHLAADLEAGEIVEVEIVVESGSALDVPGEFAPGFRVGWAHVQDGHDAAVEAAGAADVAVVVVGRVSGEAMDVDALTLPEPQERLLSAVAAVARRTVVVVVGAGPTVMPWRDAVDAILVAGNPGERGPSALARVLTGAAEPGGRLPYTIPRSESDVPLDPEGYPGRNGVAVYTEGRRVGYRGYDADGVAFAFGHGLGYADVRWVEARGVQDADGGATVTARLANPADRDGVAVVQVYLDGADSAIPRGLAGFSAVTVPAGAVVDVPVRVEPDTFEHFSEAIGARVRTRDLALISAGFASDDIRWSGEFDLG